MRASNCLEGYIGSLATTRHGILFISTALELVTSFRILAANAIDLVFPR